MAATMIQRVRFGLIGLSAVFLLVLLGAAVRQMGEDNGNAAGPGSVVVNASDGPREPLAELGVAPGNAPDESTNGQTPAAPHGTTR